MAGPSGFWRGDIFSAEPRDSREIYTVYILLELQTRLPDEARYLVVGYSVSLFFSTVMLSLTVWMIGQ